jgi:PAS domain S-box-containing protein
MLPSPDHEEQRLIALRRYAILDTPPEPSFDRLAQLAARLIGAPMSAICLVDRDRLWLKARHGIDWAGEPRAGGMCAHNLEHGGTFVVEDARADARFAARPLTAQHGVRFYAGAPLRSHDGFLLGVLCVLDTHPRTLADDKRAALQELAALVVDRLEQRCAAAALEASEARLRRFAENARDIIYRYSLSPEFRLEYFSPSFRALSGYSPEEMYADPTMPLKLVHPDDRALLEAALRSEPDDAPLSMRWIRKDGTILWTEQRRWAVRDADGRVVGVEGIARDVTIERQAEEALRRSEANFRALIERAPDGVTVVRDGLFVYGNPAALRILGCGELKALVGRAPLELIHAEDRARAAHALGDGGARPSPGREEVRATRGDGAPIDLELLGLPLTFDGRPSVLVFLRDVTERRQMQARLRLADRMASVGTLAAGVAHEINNPLAYVLSNLEQAREAVARLLPAPAELRQMLDEARAGGERVRGIVRDLKTFSRSDDERRTQVDVRRVVESSINLARNEIRHRARLTVQYGAVLPVEANESRLGQVFLNLLVNAAHAIPEGGAPGHEIAVSTGLDGGRVRVEVRDSGLGIPAEARARLFDPFFTTKPEELGTGLGLAICHRIVSSLGGEIVVESEVGRGSTFRVLLPAAAGTEVAAPPPLAPLPDLRPRRVLVIDDEPLILSTLRRVLSKDHEVTTLHSPREALERLRGGERFHVILCDLMMPELSGMELYAQMAASVPEQAARVVFVTGGAFTPSARAFLDEISNLRLEKPFEPEKLRALVRDPRWDSPEIDARSPAAAKAGRLP